MTMTTTTTTTTRTRPNHPAAVVAAPKRGTPPLRDFATLAAFLLLCPTNISAFPTSLNNNYNHRPATTTITPTPMVSGNVMTINKSKRSPSFAMSFPSSVRSSSSSSSYISLNSWQLYSSLKDDDTQVQNSTVNDDWMTILGQSQNQQQQQQEQELTVENWVDESKHVELVGLVAWMASISIFVFVNNFIGPFPEFFRHVNERFFFLGHMMGGMLFGGGIILTTAIEWLACQTKNSSVLTFWFDKVPLLDMALVLPGLTLSMVSGVGLTIVRYGGLANAPEHIITAFWALVAFAVWWGVTDLTTQGSALNAVLEASSKSTSDDLDEVPREVTGRLVSNLGSCLLVLVLYGIMVLKPGTIHYF